ncbi:Nn.00g082570.m01.CDS01 [Neocucurbitaria sp. VM-36]
MSLAPSGAESAQGSSSAPNLSRTCQNCFALKIRCDRIKRQDICDRCARLGKHCLFRPARRRDNSAKRDSRIQALEQQVQDLLRLQKSGPVVQQPLPEESAINTSASASPDQHGDVIDEEIVSIEKANTLVQVYKTDMMPHFPFVILAPRTTAGELRYTRSFLFLAILSVACFHDLNIQNKLCHCFKYMVSEKVLLGGDDCLQLEYLQGLLIVLAWNQYHGRSKYYSQYLQLAISIAVDMRLDRKPIHPKPSNAGSKRDPIAEKVGTQTWGPEEQRAAAGIFYITSTISKLLDKMNTFPCTQTIEDGCSSLRQQAEYRTDKDLYHVIRLQRIIENIDKIATSPNSDVDAQSAYLRVRSELEEFRVYLCSDVSDSQLLFMQFHTAKLFLYQVAFFERNLQHSPALHLNILCEGLEGAKSFLDLYLWLPPKSEMALTNSEWIQLSFGATLAAKFAIISREPNVEPHTRDLRLRLNIDNVFRHLALRIGSLVGRAGEGNKQKDIFLYYEQRVRKIEKWYERMLRATGVESPVSQSTNLQASAGNHQQISHSQPEGVPPNPPSATPSHVPVSVAFSHQQPHGYRSLSTHVNEPMAPTPSQQVPYQTPVGTIGMAPMSSYQQHSPAPTIAFPDLMNANGWDNMFTIPMEHDAMIFDVSQGYGLGMASPPSDTLSTWESPAAS